MKVTPTLLYPLITIEGVTWDGFNPTTDENVYGLKLFDNKAEWYGGNNKAALPLKITMHYTTTEDIYPKGPLP